MQPTHTSKHAIALFKRQKYFFKSTDDNHDDWNKVISILFPEPKFHDVIEAHGVEASIKDDWSISFQSVNATILRNGPRYSRLQKALWDNFGPLFDEYGIQLVNSHTWEPVPVKRN